MGYSVEVYDTAGYYAGQLIAESVKYGKTIQGDIFLTCSVARSGYKPAYSQGYRLVYRKGIAIKWQGQIRRIKTTRSINGYDEISVTGDGKRFDDLYAGGDNGQFFVSNNTLTEGSVGYVDFAGTGASDKFVTDARQKKLRIGIDGSTTYATGDKGGFTYAAAPGQKIRRVVFDYDYIVPGSTNWRGYVLDEAGTILWTATSTASGTGVVLTNATGWQSVSFVIHANAAASPSGGRFANHFYVSRAELYADIAGSSTVGYVARTIASELASRTASNSIAYGQVQNDLSNVVDNIAVILPATAYSFEYYSKILDRMAGYGYGSIPTDYGLDTVDVGVHRFFFRPSNIATIRYILSDADAALVDIETSIDSSYNAVLATYSNTSGVVQTTAVSYADPTTGAAVQRTLLIDVGKDGATAAATAVSLAVKNSGVQVANGVIPITQPVYDNLTGGLVEFDDILPGYCIAIPTVQAANGVTSNAGDLRDGYSIGYITTIDVDETGRLAALTVDNPLNDFERFIAGLARKH